MNLSFDIVTIISAHTIEQATVPELLTLSTVNKLWCEKATLELRLRFATRAGLGEQDGVLINKYIDLMRPVTTTESIYNIPSSIGLLTEGGDIILSSINIGEENRIDYWGLVIGPLSLQWVLCRDGVYRLIRSSMDSIDSQDEVIVPMITMISMITHAVSLLERIFPELVGMFRVEYIRCSSPTD